MHDLDRPVWHSLTGPHARFAIRLGKALRFHPQVGPLACAERDDVDGLADLAALVTADAPLFTLQAQAHNCPPGLAIERRDALQMVAHDQHPEADRNFAMRPLGADDAAEMVALATLTEPGPFALRTRELGQFWGVRIDGRLAAMAGERLRLPGFAEVSGVCTHPDYRGRGLARALMLRVMAQIRARGEVPFLTSYAHNSGAIALYETIGFRTRREMTITVLRREG